MIRVVMVGASETAMKLATDLAACGTAVFVIGTEGDDNNTSAGTMQTLSDYSYSAGIDEAEKQFAKAEADARRLDEWIAQLARANAKRKQEAVTPGTIPRRNKTNFARGPPATLPERTSPERSNARPGFFVVAKY